MPDEPEVHGLLALMLLHDARRGARFDDGELVLLADQDPARWDAAQIAAGRAALDRAIALRGRGPYVLQAAIARAARRRAARLGGDRRALRRAGAGHGLAGGGARPRRGGRGVRRRGGGPRHRRRLDLEGYHYLHATRADLLGRLGRTADARAAYDRALALVEDDAERRLLERRRAAL